MPFPIWSLRDEIDPLPLAIGALLVVSLVIQIARPAPTPASGHAAPVAPAPAINTPSGAVDYPRILAHPLFAPGRGAAGGAGVDQAASTNLADYTLVGVASVRGRGLAVLRGPAGETVSLHPGEALLGWQVAEIGRGGIVLRQGDIRRVVAVATAAAPKTGAQ